MLQLIGRRDDLVIAALEGEVDFSTSERVRAAGELLLADCRCLVLDTASLTFIDSSGITALLTLWHRLHQQQGALVLAIPDAALRQRMRYLGLDNILCVTTTLHDALAQAQVLTTAPRPRLLQGEAGPT
ncbi:STAS domain-containing protein [Streptomyces longwoodensis]|uniref:STAS domain-containing protein n=1 Tax=Streptomyces longwoodensis TaxID=68231 RepID=UPI00381E34BE